MNNIDLATAAVLQGLGILNERQLNLTNAHCKVYLFQESGMDLGFSFYWSSKGPRSDVLVEYIIENGKLASVMDSLEHQLKPKAKSNIDKVTKLMSACPEQLNKDNWCILVASLLYIINNASGWKIKTYKDATDNLTRLMPMFSNEQCECALSILRQYYDLPAMDGKKVIYYSIEQRLEVPEDYTDEQIDEEIRKIANTSDYIWTDKAHEIFDCCSDGYIMR